MPQIKQPLVVFFPFLATVLFLIGRAEKVAPGAAQVKRPLISGVLIVTLSLTPVDESYEAMGTVKTARTSVVACRMMGTVISLLVKEGNLIEKSQLLLTIDDRDVVQKVTAAEMGYQEALKALEAVKQKRGLTDITYRRYKKMDEEKAISQQEMEQQCLTGEKAGEDY